LPTLPGRMGFPSVAAIIQQKSYATLPCAPFRRVVGYLRPPANKVS
jgi:hypothetical protein